MTDISRITVFNETGIRLVTLAVPDNEVRVIRVNEGLPGRDGMDGDSIGQPAPVAFEWNNVTTRTVYTLPVDAFIVSTTVSIKTPFNGTNARLSVGTIGNAELLVPENSLDLSLPVDFETGGTIFLSAGAAIVITMNAGQNANQGAGLLVIRYVSAQ